MPYEKDTLFRNERLAELRQWTGLIKRKPIQERIGMHPESFAHWADVAFLLEEIDAIDDATLTPPFGSPPVVDPANFAETITVEALKAAPLTKKSNSVDGPSEADIASPFDFPGGTTGPRTALPAIRGLTTNTHQPLPAVQGLTTTSASPLAPNRENTLALNKVEIWDAAIAQATAAVERGLREAHGKHYDIYATKALVLKYVLECRKGE
jgi:hypothetical protein